MLDRLNYALCSAILLLETEMKERSGKFSKRSLMIAENKKPDRAEVNAKGMILL